MGNAFDDVLSSCRCPAKHTVGSQTALSERPLPERLTDDMGIVISALDQAVAGFEPSRITISGRCVRAPIVDGHLIAVQVKTAKPISPASGREIWQSYDPDLDLPSSLTEGKGMPRLTCSPCYQTSSSSSSTPCELCRRHPLAKSTQ